MSQNRTETDSLGTIEVQNDRYWGAQTQRALLHFAIGTEIMPIEIIHALALIKKVAATVNVDLNQLPQEKSKLITQAADEILAGKFDSHFPLTIWQSGSGTQTNMNVNEVIANRANELAGTPLGSKSPIHPNDHVNMSQSTNDAFPTAMHIVACKLIIEDLLPNVVELREQFISKQSQFKELVKIGRTHLQDAAPLTLGQEFSGYVAQLDTNIENLITSLSGLKNLALGGTAVGTGLNAHPEFSSRVIKQVANLTNIDFIPAANKFIALSSHDAIVMASGTLKTLACSLFKIANDIRWLASGPRCGLGELILPANEPGSSIMPGKINPTQCEAMMMVCSQVIGNDTTISFAGSQGNFELNTFKPVIIYNLIQSIKLLADTCYNFCDYAIKDLQANPSRLQELVEKSLMLVIALNPIIGYDNAAKIAMLAHKENISLRAACIKLEFLTAEEFDKIVQPQKLTGAF